jgi:hypothetical protein
MSSDFDILAGSDHELAVDLAEAVHHQVRTEDVVALAAITITSDAQITLHQPAEQLADEPIIIFALVGALNAMAANLTELMRRRNDTARSGQAAARHFN